MESDWPHNSQLSSLRPVAVIEPIFHLDPRWVRCKMGRKSAMAELDWNFRFNFFLLLSEIRPEIKSPMKWSRKFESLQVSR